MQMDTHVLSMHLWSLAYCHAEVTRIHPGADPVDGLPTSVIEGRSLIEFEFGAGRLSEQ